VAVIWIITAREVISVGRQIECAGLEGNQCPCTGMKDRIGWLSACLRWLGTCATRFHMLSAQLPIVVMIIMSTGVTFLRSSHPGTPHNLW